VAAAVCPYCHAYTSTTSGYCDSCRRPLQGAPPAAPAGPYPGYAQPAPQGYGYPPPMTYMAPPGYGQPYAYPYPPMYGPPMYGPPMVAPVYLAPVSFDPPAVQLAKLTSDARWGAGALDLLFLFVVWLLLALFVYPSIFQVGGQWWVPVRILTTGSLFYLYYALMEGFAGGTLGKRAIGLVLVDRDLKPIGPGKAFARAFEIFIWPFGFIIILLIQSVLIEKNGQSAGDRWAGTYLVRRRYLNAAPRAGQAAGR
jgi:uncharacterized RDD family membrane protein YckC